MDYRFTIERGSQTLQELWPLYTAHYGEMQARLARDGVTVAAFNPRVDEYIKSWDSGHLVNYIVRTEDGEAVGYSNIYVTNDMHNNERIAQEDTIFILKAHRNGVGRRLAKFIIADLGARGVKRIHISPVTDLRVGKIWQRMGFKPVAQLMTYTF